MALSNVTSEVLDPKKMRLAMSQFASGVTVVTTLDDTGAPAGCTVSAFSSLSLDPPLVLVCIGKDRSMARWLMEGVGFVVNTLVAEQVDVALGFGGRASDRFSSIRWTPGHNGMPLIDGALTHVECTLEAVEEGGDHWIVVGRVVEATIYSGTPLLYSQGGFGRGIGRQPSEPADMPSSDWLISAPW